MPSCPMKNEFEAFRASGGDQAPRHGQGSACAVTTTLATLPAGINDRPVPNYNLMTPLAIMTFVGGPAAMEFLRPHFIFDNATDVNVIGDERLAPNLESTQARLIGFNGARSDAVGIGAFPERLLGKALFVPPERKTYWAA